MSATNMEKGMKPGQENLLISVEWEDQKLIINDPSNL